MMHVITGGSGSGKSAYAEMWLTGKPEKSEEKKENWKLIKAELIRKQQFENTKDASIWCRDTKED